MQKLNENPATRDTPAAERKRIPMSVPVRKLEVPDIPGYHLHWFRSDAARIQRAQEGGYEFVDAGEIRLNPVGLGADTTHSGNTDMGSRVSVISGESADGVDAERMILMKIKQEWYDEDQKLVEARNDSVAAALTSGVMTNGPGGSAADAGENGNFRYVDKSRTKLPAMFTKNKK